MSDSLLFQGSEWTFPLLETVLREVEEIGINELGAELLPNRVEVITADQMLEAYTSSGMPIHYHHWSNGKSYLQQKQAYQGGMMGLAYEIVINSKPCIAYCMESNSMAMQALVLAHASVGHNSFFNENYLFKHWTDPEAVVDYLIFAKNYIKQCEERYGLDEVEEILDSAHTLTKCSFDRRKRTSPFTEAQEQERRNKLLEELERERSQFDDLITAKPVPEGEAVLKDGGGVLKEPEENLLYFLEKNAPNLKSWQREVLRIVRTINQYFYPQIQTQVMNEGWATFTHHYILNRLYEMGKIDEGTLLECMASHTNVIWQQEMTANFNPYALGFAMFTDLKRICEEPTAEDREWFPDIAGSDWRTTLKFAMQNFRDESFIQQYLSPKLMRDFRMFTLEDDAAKDHYEVQLIHNEPGYKRVRQQLAEQYKLENKMPNLMVVSADMKKDRTLTVEHRTRNGVLLKDDTAKQVMEHLCYLWGYKVVLKTMDEDGKMLHSYTASYN